MGNRDYLGLGIGKVERRMEERVLRSILRSDLDYDDDVSIAIYKENI